MWKTFGWMVKGVGYIVYAACLVALVTLGIAIWHPVVHLFMDWFWGLI